MNTYYTYIGDIEGAFDINGNCIKAELPWKNKPQFAQLIEGHEHDELVVVGEIGITYDAETDGHHFYRRQETK